MLAYCRENGIDPSSGKVDEAMMRGFMNNLSPDD
jgi:hypothetical protein